MAKPVHITDPTFDAEVLKSDLVVIVDLWAEWCKPCLMIAPLLDEIALEYADYVKVVKLNVDENPVTPSQFGVLSIPTLLVFKNGQYLTKVVGAVPKEEILKAVQPYFHPE